MEKMICVLFNIIKVIWKIRASICLLLLVVSMQLLTKDEATNIAIISLVIILVLKQLLFELERRVARIHHSSGKRLTKIDRFGNPCIDSVDLPQAIEKLYEMEEEIDE